MSSVIGNMVNAEYTFVSKTTPGALLDEVSCVLGTVRALLDENASGSMDEKDFALLYLLRHAEAALHEARDRLSTVS